MAWYYANGGQQAGPVDDAAFENLVRQGVVRDDSLVWKEGMAEWKPYASVRPAPMAAAPTVVMQIPPGGFFAEKPVEPAAPAPAPAPVAAAPASQETRFCSQCGRPTLTSQLTMVNGAPTCPACAAVVHQAPRPVAPQPMAQPMSQQPMGQPMQPQAPQQPWSPQMGVPGMGMGAPGMQAPGAYRFAGFWIRFVAFLIDGILVGIVSFVITLPLMFLGIGSAVNINPNDPSAALSALPAIMAAAGISSLIRIALFVAYEAYFLSTRGATLGKIALGLKVIRTDGGPISVGLAVGRAFGYILSGIILYIGYIMAGFDPQKRALHDRICNTYVIYAK
jgi:uncharacterized RDD family membrane protein YckC